VAPVTVTAMRRSFADKTTAHQLDDPARSLGEVDPLVIGPRQQVVHGSHGGGSFGGLREGAPRLLALAPPCLQAQQAGDRLQVVLHAMMHLADGRLHDADLTLAPPCLGEILDQDERVAGEAPGCDS